MSPQRVSLLGEEFTVPTDTERLRTIEAKVDRIEAALRELGKALRVMVFLACFFAGLTLIKLYL